MPDVVIAVFNETAWPIALALAWVAGELGSEPIS